MVCSAVGVPVPPAALQLFRRKPQAQLLPQVTSWDAVALLRISKAIKS